MPVLPLTDTCFRNDVTPNLPLKTPAPALDFFLQFYICRHRTPARAPAQLFFICLDLQMFSPASCSIRPTYSVALGLFVNGRP